METEQKETMPDGDDELATLRAQLAEANARAEENHSKLLYALADFENLRKRGERQLQDRLAAGKRTTLAKFLPVLDNLERALSFGLDSEGLRGGLEATQRGFEALLESEGVKPLSVLGTVFDPRIAEAIGTRDTEDVEDGLVVDEVQRGYTLGDELLRPAHVIVANRARRDEDKSET
jgi:molecular chaperone GrpE